MSTLEFALTLLAWICTTGWSSEKYGTNGGDGGVQAFLQNFSIRARFMKYFIKMLPFFHVFHFHHF